MQGYTSAHLSLDVPTEGRPTGETMISPMTGFRAERMRRYILPLIEDLSKRLSRVRILDMGGTLAYWRPVQDELVALNCELTLTNLEKPDEATAEDDPLHGRVTCAAGDARHMDFADNSFDLVHANSVIEHVGMWLDMRSMAEEVRRLAPAYFVQTPNFWFPYEPHYRLPFFHWAPEQVRAWLMTTGVVKSWPRAPTMLHAVEWIQRAYLLDAAQMRALFPDGRQERERLALLTKSIMAIRTGA